MVYFPSSAPKLCGCSLTSHLVEEKPELLRVVALTVWPPLTIPQVVSGTRALAQWTNGD